MSGRLREALRHRVNASQQQEGAAAVEFGLVVPIFIALVLGIIQFGWYFYAANSASGAAREGARRLVVGDCWTGFETFVQDQAPGIDTATYTPALPGADVGDPITVTVTADGSIVEFFPWGPQNGQISKTFTARLEQDGATGTCP
jgi:hypothetical protein